jgi:O-antigen/teichoic acid export membrane protein
MAGNAGAMAILTGQAIALTPWYLRCIGARMFGAWLGTGDMLVWLLAFDLGLPNLMIQRIGAAHGRKDAAAVGAWFASGMAVLLAISTSLAAGGALLAASVPRWVGIVGADAALLSACFRVSAISAAACVLNNGFVAFSRGIQDTAKLNIVMLVSVFASLLTAIAALAAGLGLWAPALASAARACTLLAGGAIFALPYLRGPLRGEFRVRWRIVRELFSVLPAAALGGIGYGAMNQSQIALAAMFLRPEAAVVLSFTRKAADLLRSIADSIGISVYGSFASLAGSSDGDRTRQVFHQICALHSAALFVGAAAYLAVNRALVGAWVGSSHYGGAMLTILIATESTLAGSAYLVNYLYRATGRVAQGSMMLVLESIVRIPLMILGLKTLGLAGPPLAASLTAGASLLLVRCWTLNSLPKGVEAKSGAATLWLCRALLGAAAVWLCIGSHPGSWLYVAPAMAGIGLSGGAAFILADPRLSETRRWALSMPVRLLLSRPPMFSRQTP